MGNPEKSFFWTQKPAWGTHQGRRGLGKSRKVQIWPEKKHRLLQVTIEIPHGALTSAVHGRNTPRAPQQKPAVGTRVSHATRGIGSVTEHMEDGRDDGDEHRYNPSSWHKLSGVRV